MTRGLPTVTAVVLAWQDQPLLETAVRALLSSTGVEVGVVVVDNGSTAGAVDAVGTLEHVTVVRPGRNTGFTGGCRLGVEASTGDFVALVNSDAVVTSGALAALAAVAGRPDVGIATASVRLHSDPAIVNSAGNPVHFLLLSWAGGLGEPAAQHEEERDVASASGAACMLRREVWDSLGGFADEFFAYHEDTELSLRCWQRGLRVVYVPDAVVTHDYAFARNQNKMYLLERNRLAMLATLPQARTLALLAVPAAALEAGLLALAVREGWWREKLRGWWWLIVHGRRLAARRAQVQRARLVGDRAMAPLFAERFDARAFPLSGPLKVADALLALWWRRVRDRLLPASPQRL